MSKQMDKQQLIAWNRQLHAMSDDIVYRIGGTEPTQNFYRDLAESLEALAERVRRNIQQENAK